MKLRFALFGIMAIALALGAALLPARRLPTPETVELFQVQYEPIVPDDSVTRDPMPVFELTPMLEVLDTPKIEIEPRKTVKRAVPVPAELREEIFSTLLEREGFSQAAETKVLPSGLVLTTYDDVETALEEINTIFDKINISTNIDVIKELRTTDVDKRVSIMRDWIQAALPSAATLTDENFKYFDQASRGEKEWIINNLFDGQLNQKDVDTLIDLYETKE